MRLYFSKFFFIVIIGMVACAIWYGLQQAKSKPPNTVAATFINSHKKLTEFNLISTKSQPFTEKNLYGKWTLIFFGYRTCPEICPHTLNILKTTWNEHFTQYQPTQFVFASLVPENNNLSIFKDFLANYHPSFIGITGTEDNMEKLSSQLAISKTILPESSSEQLLMDHTAALMLIDPQAKLKAVFTPPLDPNNIAKDLIAITKVNK